MSCRSVPRELRGEPCLELEEFAPGKAEIRFVSLFGERVTDYEEMPCHLQLRCARGKKKPAASTSTSFHLNIRQNIPLAP